MASIQQLEKLYQIEKIFHVESSLEAAVAGERIRSVITRTEQTMRQRAFLREERRRLRVATEKLEERKKALKLIERADWLPTQLLGEQKTVRINVGGLMFEANEDVLQRDPDSLLCKLTTENPPLLPETDGSFVFNRDWWLFRFILAFLRDGVLPDDRGLLAQLYKETTYWHLSEMQHAIEEQKLHLKKTSKVPNVDEVAAEAEKKKWWRQQPSWWRAVNAADATAAEKERMNKGKGKDWWTSHEYKGMTFATADVKKVAKANKPTEGTWGTGAASEDEFGYGNSGGYGSSTRTGSSFSQLPDPYHFLDGKTR